MSLVTIEGARRGREDDYRLQASLDGGEPVFGAPVDVAAVGRLDGMGRLTDANPRPAVVRALPAVGASTRSHSRKRSASGAGPLHRPE